MRALKGVLVCFCALSEPSVRFRINGLRFVSVLSRQRSRVRAPSSPPDSKGLKSDLACGIKVQKGTTTESRPPVGPTEQKVTGRQEAPDPREPLLLSEFKATEA